MSRSSTSNSDPGKATGSGFGAWFRPRLLSSAVAVAAGALVTAEGLLQSDVVRAVLPMPKPYYSHNVELRKRLLARVVKKYGRLDILFIGSSIVRTNVRADILDDELARHGVHTVSFNGGLSGLGPASVALYLDRFYLPQASPQIVLHGVRLSELLDQNSENYELLQGSAIESTWMTPGVPGRLREWMASRMALLYYHGMVAAAIQRFRAPIAGQRLLFQVDERGHSEPQVDLSRAKAKGWIFEAPVYDSEIDPSRLAAGLVCLRRAYEHCRRAEVKYVLVNVPEHGDKYLSTPGGEQTYRRYLALLATYASELGISFIDVTGGDPSRYRADELFSDYHHMVAPGSERFTKELGEALVGLASQLRLVADLPAGASREWPEPNRSRQGGAMPLGAGH